MKIFLLFLLVWVNTNRPAEGTYVSKSVKINLFCSTPMADVNATSAAGTSAYNPATGELSFSLAVNSFVFEKSLMQKHFNEKYMESDRYPKASFNGKVNEKIDAGKSGTYPVHATGVLEMHGVKKARTIAGTITVKYGVLSLESKFIVEDKDHNIDVPKMVFKKVAQQMAVTVNAVYTH